jgi:hypothetical protein
MSQVAGVNVGITQYNAPGDAIFIHVIPNSIFLGYVHPGTVHGKFPLRLLNYGLHPANMIVGGVTSSAGSNAKARNDVIEMFLGTDAEWLFWIDDDAITFPDAPGRLRKYAQRYNAKIAAALSFGYDHNKNELWVGAWNWTGEEYAKIVFYPQAPFWVDAVGCHATLVHRDAYELVEYPWHQYYDEHPDTGKYMSHDVGFCYKLNQQDERVLYCPPVKTWHIKDWEIGEKEWMDYAANASA